MATKPITYVIDCPKCGADVEFNLPNIKGKNSLSAKIVALLTESKTALHVGDIREAFPEKSDSLIRNTLSNLKADGMVDTVQRGYWTNTVLEAQPDEEEDPKS